MSDNLTEFDRRGETARHEHAMQLVALNLIELRKILHTLVSHVCGPTADNHAILAAIAKLESTIMATQAEQAAILRTLVSQVTTVRTEVQGVQTAVNEAKAKIVELEAIIAAGSDASPELVEAVAAVKEAVQFVDDEIPNLPPVPPVV